MASYAAMLRAAATRAGHLPLEIDAGEGRGRWARRLRAALPGARRAARGDTAIVRRDLFREAQVHFDIHGKPLAVAVPGEPGIAHWAYPVPILLAGWRNLYTVHDAIPLVHPELTPIDAGRHRRLLGAIAARAGGFATVTTAARDEIVAALGCDPGFVVDLGEAVDVAAPGALPAGLRAGGYLLHAGTIEPRKNIARIVAGWEAAGRPLPLAFAGPDGWRADEYAAALAQPGIVRPGYVDRATMLALIAGARALVMPSLAEGFGLPVAEAMALGTPVLTSDRGALAEVAGGAALAVDPEDTAAIGRAIAALARDGDLCESLAAMGLARAPAFGPAAFAARLGEWYGAMSG